MLITDAVHIWREADGDYHIEWQASHPDTEVTVEPLEVGAGVSAHYAERPSHARISGLPGASRHRFRLRDQHGNEVLSTQRIGSMPCGALTSTTSMMFIAIGFGFSFRTQGLTCCG